MALKAKLVKSRQDFWSSYCQSINAKAGRKIYDDILCRLCKFFLCRHRMYLTFFCRINTLNFKIEETIAMELTPI